MVNTLKNVKLPFENGTRVSIREFTIPSLCNRFPSCSVNNCPLDPEYPERYVDPSDPEKKCKYAKSYRMQIAEQFPGLLKFGGLTQLEYKRKQRWNAMPEEEKQIRIQRIAEVNARRWGNVEDHPDIRDVTEVSLD